MFSSSFLSLFHPSLLPDCRSPLPLATAAADCWIKHCCSFSQQICRLHQIRLPLLYPITDGSSKLIQDLSWTNVTPCFLFKTNGAQISSDRHIHTEQHGGIWCIFVTIACSWQNIITLYDCNRWLIAFFENKKKWGKKGKMSLKMLFDEELKLETE